MRRADQRRWLKRAAFAAFSLPLLWLFWGWADAAQGGLALSADPVKATVHELGQWAVRLLLLTLAISPAARWTGYSDLLSIRRTAGLFAFGYAMLHLLTYAVLDRLMAWDVLWADVTRRPAIVFGAAALLVLTPLAITSTSGWIKRLGARRWSLLHRSVYAAGALAVLHHHMMVKGVQPEPVIHIALLAGLLGVRLIPRLRAPMARTAAKA